jgi:hypothetical protein
VAKLMHRYPVAPSLFVNLFAVDNSATETVIVVHQVIYAALAAVRLNSVARMARDATLMAHAPQYIIGQSIGILVRLRFALPQFAVVILEIIVII